MFDDPLYKRVFHITALVVAIMLLCRFTNGYAIIAVAIIGAFYALRGNAGVSLFFYILLPTIALITPLILPRPPMVAIVSRLTSLAIVAALILGGAKRKGSEQLPLGYIFPYLVIALISSFQGYFPLISYFKILNFTAFILGLFIGTRNINQNKKDIDFMRAAFLSIAIVVVWGSLATLPFPAIAYFTSARSTIMAEGLEAAEVFLAEREGTGLFSGITAQSQFLGPCLVCLGGWVACDMLFVERRLRLLHLLLLAPSPIMIAMTRSRIGILTFFLLIAMLTTYCLPRIQIQERDRKHIRTMLFSFIVILVLILIVAESRRGTISRLLRKTNDLAEDQRTLIEALTSSRQGKLHECIHDFRMNPLWGMGFQVIADHPRRYQQGDISLFSAPIEKGILPIMVLGETGILGTIAFLFFLLLFYKDAAIRGYTATLTLFSVLLGTNMAEATFFSPSGGGGIFWMFTVCGGFLIDMSLKTENAGPPPDTVKGTAPLNPYRRSRISLGPIPKR
jgi:hypothetical protein